jgi:hypothetical protein
LREVGGSTDVGPVCVGPDQEAIGSNAGGGIRNTSIARPDDGMSAEGGHEPYRESLGDPPAWVPVIDQPEAEGVLADVYARIRAPDEVAHIIGVQSLHPKALEAHVRLYRTIMFDRSPLSRAQRESIAVVVSAINDCFY